MQEQELVTMILKEAKTLAVVGLSPKEHRTSHKVSSYLQENGYRIIPVYPREDKILGEKVYRNVSEIKEKVDLVLVFRRSEEVVEIVKDALSVKPAYLWMQQGIVNEEAAEIARAAGIKVIMDKCMYKEHMKL